MGTQTQTRIPKQIHYKFNIFQVHERIHFELKQRISVIYSRDD